MHDTGKVLAGLVVFLAIATSPAWYHALSGAAAEPPEFDIVGESQQCLAPTEYMRTFHMDLLDAWREEAVRTPDTIFIGLDGKPYQKSLSGTCLGDCHSNKDEFCVRCHDYVGADPYCWNCHGSPEGAL
jgi:hypothetical protein